MEVQSVTHLIHHHHHTNQQLVQVCLRSTAESLGDSSSNSFAEMSFTIEKATVTAKSKKHFSIEYTLELAQDLKAIHGLDEIRTC